MFPLTIDKHSWGNVVHYPTALLFAQEAYFDNRLTGEAYRSLFDF